MRERERIGGERTGRGYLLQAYLRLRHSAPPSDVFLFKGTSDGTSKSIPVSTAHEERDPGRLVGRVPSGLIGTRRWRWGRAVEGVLEASAAMSDTEAGSLRS